MGLIEKYNIPVPRYTSYPPATYFTGSFTAGDYIEAVRNSNKWDPESVSLYFHIPFCKKMCFYCGCNSCLASGKESIENYFGALEKELSITGRLIDPSRKVTQIHFGGGTPNSVPADFLARLMDTLRQYFILSVSPEIAIECNPAYLDITYLQQLINTGFNRFSLGIQDFNLQVLNNVNRDPSSVPVEEIVSFLRSENDDVKVNLDFIYGLPGQTPGSFEDTIRKAIDIRPDRLVTFSYAHVPWVNKTQKILEKRGLPDNEIKADMYRNAYGLLTENGYRAIGLDHFVLENDELFLALEKGKLHRNFQGYCTRDTTGQVYAFGVSAISQLKRVYSQNTKSVDEYITLVKGNVLPVKKGYLLNDREIIIREVISELMCNKTINWASLAERMNITIPEILDSVNYDQQLMRQFKDDGIIDYDDDSVRITGKGSLFIRNVAASLDPLMADTAKKFSRSF